MNPLTSPAVFRHEALTVEAATSDGALVVSWLGRSEGNDPGRALGPFLQQLADLYEDRPVVLDFRNLEYMSSSTVIPIFQLIKDLNRRGISTKVLYSSSKSWQHKSFSALKTVCEIFPHVEVTGQP